MQKGDVEATFADQHLWKLIDFKPNTPISKGVSEFVSWFENFIMFKLSKFLIKWRQLYYRHYRSRWELSCGVFNLQYKVHGLKRRSSSFNTARIDHLYQDPHNDFTNLVLHHGDLTDSTNLIRIIQQIQPDEIQFRSAKSCGGKFREPRIYS